MKRKSKEKRLLITRPTKFFLEDLEQIYSILIETMDRVSIENDEYEFGNIHDLLEIKSPPLKNLRLTGYKNNWPVIDFVIYPYIIIVSTNDDNPSFLGTIEKIRGIIDIRKQRLIPSRSVLPSLSILGLVLAVLYLIIRYLLNNQEGIFNLLPEISLLISVPTFFMAVNSRNQIILSYSNNSPTFWKRNSDTIIVAIITSILTLIIGYIFGKVIGFIH